MEKRVMIVKEGHWGAVKPEDYQGLIEVYKRILERGGIEIIFAVETAEEAEKMKGGEKDGTGWNGDFNRAVRKKNCSDFEETGQLYCPTY